GLHEVGSSAATRCKRRAPRLPDPRHCALRDRAHTKDRGVMETQAAAREQGGQRSLRRRGLLFWVVGWTPLPLITALEWLLGRDVEPLIHDLSVHARVLVALPLLLAADRLLDLAAHTVTSRLRDEGYVPPSEEPRVNGLLAAVQRWRDSWL